MKVQDNAHDPWSKTKYNEHVNRVLVENKIIKGRLH